MYLQHFALREFPFSLTPDTEFFFRYGSHQEAHNVLLVALRSGEGFIKLTGEVGTGKTLLCRLLLKTLGDEFVTAYIPNPYLTPAALHRALADELGIEHARNGGQDRLLKLISERLIELNNAGKRVALLLDEAQTLPPASMEALRLLTNLETEKYKLLQVVLFGQPELDQRLAQRDLRQLRQRITFAHRLRPIDRAGFEGYIVHRLHTAGYQGPPLFTQRAFDDLYRASRGIPRLINVLCHKALLAAYGLGELQVQPQHVRMAALDTEDVLPQAAHRRLARAVFGTVSIAATLIAGLGAMYFWGHAL
ncbi:MAG: ExeA family protein [Gammaproteobacteria bacterium]